MAKTLKEERCKSALFEIVTDGIENAIARENLSIKDFESIGIAGELKKLQQLSAKFCAEDILRDLRNPNFDDDFDDKVKMMKEWISIANITFRDLGIGKKEIQKLRKKYYLREAESYLHIIREEFIPDYARGYPEEIKDHWNSMFYYLREFVSKGKLTLKELGTSEEEIATLKEERLK